MSGAGPEVVVASVMSILAGAGSTLVLGGAAALRLDLLVVGGLLAGVALSTLLAAGWLAGLTLVAVSLPLPPVYSTEGLRLGAPLVATALAVGGWLLLGGSAPRRSVTARRSPDRAVLAFLAAVVMAGLFAEVRVAAVREMVNMGLLVALLYLALDELRRSPRRVHRLALVLAGVTAAAGVLAGLEAVGLIPGRFPLGETRFQRATGGFGWPNELGMFFTIGLPFTVYAYRRAETPAARALGATAAVLAGVGLVATFSRGSWLSTLLAPTVLLLVGEGRWVARFWLAALLVAAGVDVVTGGAIHERALASLTDSSAAQRLALMAAGVLMVAAHPFTGVGPGGFGDALEQFGLQVPGLWDFVGSAHNAYLHLAAETGLPGLAAFVWLLGSIGWVLLGSVRRAAPGSDDRLLTGTLLWAFAAACVVGLFEWTLVHGIGQLVVMVAAMGLALAAREDPPMERERSVSGGVRGGGAPVPADGEAWGMPGGDGGRRP